MITTGSCHRSFGFLVLKRVLDKMPSLKPVFKLNEFESLNDIPKEHSFIRHTGLFQSIIELAIRNIDELESEIAPVLFAYGRRHYEHDLVNNAPVCMLIISCSARNIQRRKCPLILWPSSLYCSRRSWKRDIN